MTHLADVKYKDDYVQLLVEFVAADAFQVNIIDVSLFVPL